MTLRNFRSSHAAPVSGRSSPASRRCSVLATLLALLWVVGASCIPWKGGPRYQRGDGSGYWSAISSLDLDAAIGMAPDEDHRRLALGLHLLLGGDLDRAERELRELSEDAESSLVRGIARARLASLLVYEQNWSDLAKLAEADRDAVSAQGPDRTSFLAWAAAMRRAPAARYPVPDRPLIVPMTRSPTGVPIIVARINGCSRRLWIDTGASTSLLSSSVAASCGVPPLVDDTLEMLTSTGRVSAQPAVITQMQIGDLAFRNVHAAIVSDQEMRIKTNSEPGRIVYERIDGIVGFDLLRRYDVEIDYGRDRIILRQSEARASSDFARRNLFWLGYPVVRLVHEGGTPTFFGLDTGADYSFATSNILLKLPKSYLSRERHRIAGIGSDTTQTLPVLHHQEFEVGRTALRFGELPIRDLQWLLLIELDGILGSDIGAVGRIRFDMGSGSFSIGPSR